MSTIRDVTPYTVVNLPTNGVVTLPAWMGIEDAITALQQRGKVVLSMHGMNSGNIPSPIIGYNREVGASGNYQITIGNDHSAAWRFQIPTGYNRYTMIVKHCSPQTFKTLAAVTTDAYSSIDVGFCNGPDQNLVAWTFYYVGQNSEQIFIIDGLLPIVSNTGQMESGFVRADMTIRDAMGVAFPTSTVAWHYSAPYVGISEIHLCLYRDDQC